MNIPISLLAKSAFAVAVMWSAAAGAAESTVGSHQFAIGTSDFLLDGRRFQIRCGEMHFARVPREYWQDRLRTIKAMGLNTVCVYLFWNYHEWNEGKFDWSGQRDAAEFCRLAQQEGLWVILRPGPYACAEWEMGGLPWWLLKKGDGDFLRTSDPRFIEPCRQWFNEVGRVLGPLQVTHGGPILMVQVENEYGFYGKDLNYMRTLRQIVLNAGFNVPLFCCNPTNEVVRSHIPELFSVANFGSDPQRGFEALDEIQKGPRMCGEFYPGWFDTWGTPHKRGHMDAMLRDLEYMLKVDGSFSLYMAHGGTTFGMWAGCDRPFRPDTSSYDYDAPISEAGWTTPKFAAIRELMSRYLLPGETIPDPPAANPVMEIPAFSLNQTAPVLDNLPSTAIEVQTPRNIEAYNISRGLITYRATVPPGPAGMLSAANVRDFAWVFLDGRQVGMMEDRHRRFSVNLPARTNPASLEILLYTLSRVNFGVEVHDRKGLQGPIYFTPRDGEPQEISGWQILPMDFGADAAIPQVRWQNGANQSTGKSPAFWRGSFDLTQTGDTFLDVSNWGFGLAWVNGHCLGKFWNIGPTQTMYVPRPWLQTGSNDVVLLDLVGPDQPVLSGVKTPVLDRLRPEKDFYQKNDKGVLKLDGVSPAIAGQFQAGSATQQITFSKPVTGLQFCLECLDAWDGKESAAVAEIALLDASGNPINQSAWTIAYADSEESESEDGSALNAINGQVSDYWHTQISGGKPAHFPHYLVIDLGGSVEVCGLRYTPRQGPDSVAGRIKDYRAFVGDNLVTQP